MQKGFQSVNFHGDSNGVIATPVIGENGNCAVVKLVYGSLPLKNAIAKSLFYRT